MDLSTLAIVVRDAVRRIILEQWDLHAYDVGERTVTSQLFRYMTEHNAVPGYLRVDHEYNRHEGATKTVRSLIWDDDLDEEGELRIHPDVIIHRRGDDAENWLVLEAKRGNSCDELDRMKVEALIDQYGYRWAAP